MVSLNYKVVMSRSIDFPATSFSLIVRVVSNESGNPPIQGADVVLVSQNLSMSQKTNQDGEVIFHDLARGTYSLTVRKEGFLDHKQSVSVPQQEVLIRLKKLLELVIEVKDQDTSQPVQGARVKVEGEQIEREVYTDQNGIARVQVVEGQYTVTVSKEGYVDSRAQVTVPLPQGQNKLVVMLKKQSASPPPSQPPSPPPPPQPDRTLLLAGLIAVVALVAAFTLLSSDTSEEGGEE